jgi:hypothetical protein
MKSDARARLVVAIIAAVLCVPAGYALQRIGDVLFKQEPNPATVIQGTSIAMFWRLKIAAFIAPVVGVLVHEIARRDLARTLRAVYGATLMVAVLATAQGIFVP